MFKNYLRITLRHFIKHKAYTLINVSGLAIGLTCCILILLFVQDELSFDRHHRNADRIYRLTAEETNEGRVRHVANAYGPLAPAMRVDFPEIEQVTRIFPYEATVESGDKRFQESRFFLADSNIFDVFSYDFIQGNAASALSAPVSVVITASTAKKYFGDGNPIGQALKVEGEFTFTVSAVVADLPQTSHFIFDFLASYERVPEVLGWNPHWHWPPVYTYTLLPESLSPGTIETQFPKFLEKHNQNEGWRFLLQPLTDIHLNPNLENEIAPTGNKAYVYLFSLIAFFILLIACFNFMNLSTARSAARAREVGLRKIVGAKRQQLIRQFLGESVWYAVAAMLIALVLVEVVLPVFNDLVGKQVDANYFANRPLTLGLLALTVLVGVLSGSYPAFFLSGFRPLKVLKNKSLSISANKNSLRFRSLLVVLQFAISIGLIIVTYVVSSQLNFIQNKRLGFNKEHLLVIPLRDEVSQQKYEAIKSSFLNHAGIRNASVLSNFPWQTGFYDFPIEAEGVSRDSEIMFPILLVDEDFVRTFEADLVDGRDFSKTFGSEKNSFILNETAVKTLGWESPLQKKMAIKHIAAGKDVEGRVVGIVQDFHFRSLHHKIDPLAILIAPVQYFVDNLVVRFDGSNISETLVSLEQTWRQFVPNRPFNYFFLDQDFDALYQKERKLSSIFQGFAGLAIFIACLGLFGLASFSIEQRRKEIGIRKTLGATVSNISILLSKEFARLTILANIISWPLTFYYMKNWLENFAYRIELSLPIFVASGMIALSIALLTISYQAVKAALANPVESLRHE